MTAQPLRCRRCGRLLAHTPPEVRDLPWFDAHRVSCQGWLGRLPEEAVGVECLTPDEANFLLPDRAGPPPRHRRLHGRLAEFVPDWMHT